METRQQLIKCLICGLYNCNIEQLKDKSTKSSLISKHLQVIFLLRNILEVPVSKLVIFLKSHPNLESWLSLCDKCIEVVNQCKTTYQTILEAQTKFSKRKQEIIQLLKNSALIKQEPNEIHDNHLDIVEEIRGFVYQNKYPKNTDPFTSGDRLAYQHLSHKVDKALKQLEEEDDVDYDADNQSWGSNDDLQEDPSDEWMPSDNEHVDLITLKPKKPKKPTTSKRRKGLSSKKYKRGTFRCPSCPKTFLYKMYLNRHIKYIHDQRLSANCDQCGAAFPSNRILLQHQPKCTGQSIPCPVPDCPRKLANEPALTRHLRDTHGTQKVEDPRKNCKFCGKYFSLFHRLEKHIRTIHQHTNDILKCDLCGVGKSSKGDLKTHRENCKGKSLSCPVTNCEVKCGNYTALNYHVTSTHKDKVDEIFPFKCLECEDNRGYMTNQQLKNHMCKNHKKPKVKGLKRYDKTLGPFICETCGGTYASKGLLRNHRSRGVNCKLLRGEELGGPVICEVCGGSFKNKGGLRMHVKVVHERRFTMKCEICGQGRNGKARMELHMWQCHKVGDERKWVCGVEGCTVKMYGRKDREDHMRRHRGEEPRYKCEECGKGFYMHVNIMQHVKEVHQGKRAKRGSGGRVKREEEEGVGDDEGGN